MTAPIRLLIAPNAFKGTLTAREAAEAIAAGLRDVSGAAPFELELLPVADGGDGTLDVLLEADAGFAERIEPVTGPLGDRVVARWGWRESDGTALIEMAEASGLRLLSPERRDPLRASTRGVGELIEAARRAGAERIVLGVGGSATVDAGAGALEALGWRFFGPRKGPLSAPRGLDRLARVEPPRWSRPTPPIDVLCDVNNPLLGPEGAAAVFGPQKGAKARDVPRLEKRLANFARAMNRRAEEREFQTWTLPETPGSGAAGGLAYGLAAALGARLAPGAARTLELLRFSERLANADAVVTGEGKLDAQTSRGKAPAAVANAAREAGLPRIALCGVVEAGAENLFDLAVAAPGATKEEAAEALAAAAREIAPRVAELAVAARRQRL